MEVISGGKETILSALRPYGMQVPPNRVWKRSRSPHIISGYLLREERKGLKSKSHY